MSSILAATLLSILPVVFVGICVFFCRRYFVRRSKGTSVGAAGAEPGTGQWKALNDVIDWVFSQPHPGVEEWVDGLARALTQQAATSESLEDFKLRVEKISNFETPPQFSNLSTQHSTSDKSLVVRAEVLWKRFDLSLSLTSEGSAAHNALCSSVDSRVNVFEFQSSVEGKLLSSDGITVLTVKFPTEPKMRLEVKRNQEGNIDIAELERQVRMTISKTEFRFPFSVQSRSVSISSTPPEHFELQNKTKLLETTPDRTKKLLVKIIKASGLMTSQEKDYAFHQPFCTVSMDNPAQCHVTSSVKNTANPFFDEQFIFDLDHVTRKLTFEVHDKDRPVDDDFLGMAFLTVDDFSRNRHVLPLTGRGPMTFGSLTVEVSVVDSAKVPSIMATSHNVKLIAPPASPVVLVSDADDPTSLPILEIPTGTQDDPASRDSKTLPPSGSLPPKGGDKKKSLVGTLKKRFKRKKTDSRSQSADRAQGTGPGFGGGIYLTPPPSRASANVEYEDLPLVESEHRSRSNSLRRNLGRLFHLRRRKDSPTSTSGRDLDHSPEGSVGLPSPRLGSASPNRQPSPQPTAPGLWPSASEQPIR